MGLDMYLVKTKKGGEFEVDLNDEGVGYWRKFNALHAWFVDNIQDRIDSCQPHSVSKENLETLLRIAKEIGTDAEKASRLLPTREGFFFGSTDYDERYFRKLKDTVEILTRVLAETDFDTKDLYYCSIW